MESLVKTLEFYNGKRVFLTGHTGFKGAWLSYILSRAGAVVTGYSLEPLTQPSLFEIAGIANHLNSVIGDIRDAAALKNAFDAADPEIVIHMAAQPLVCESYREPAYTYETNVMGTVNILECVRLSGRIKSFLNITTDKVYENRECQHGYREDEKLDGYDPYSNSKSCSELVTHSYRRSFFEDGAAISTARAGNVIGGGDFSDDRIIPDCVRAALRSETIAVRNPNSVRPYQHVLEPLLVYLEILRIQWFDRTRADWYNVGPDEQDCLTTGELVDIFCRNWGKGLQWETRNPGGPHEANFLQLDCTKVKAVLGWRPRWHAEKAVAMTVEWTQCWANRGDVRSCMAAQLEDYFRGGKS